MFRLRLLVLAVVLVVLSSPWVGGQDKAKEEKPTTKMRGQLPQNWGKLGLSDEQKQKVYHIRGEYQTKIDALRKQLDDLREKERKELETVLTEAQKERLREIVAGKAPGGKTTKEKSPSP